MRTKAAQQMCATANTIGRGDGVAMKPNTLFNEIEKFFSGAYRNEKTKMFLIGKIDSK